MWFLALNFSYLFQKGWIRFLVNYWPKIFYKNINDKFRIGWLKLRNEHPWPRLLHKQPVKYYIIKVDVLFILNSCGFKQGTDTKKLLGLNYNACLAMLREGLAGVINSRINGTPIATQRRNFVGMCIILRFANTRTTFYKLWFFQNTHLVG